MRAGRYKRPAQRQGAALLVDPADESVLLFRPGQSPQPLPAAEPIEFGDLLPGFRLSVQELFDSLKLA